MRRSWAGLVVLTLASCVGADEVRPDTVSQRGGEVLHVHTREPFGPGGMVVLVDGIPAHSVVIEGPRLLRASLPSLPRAGRVNVELVAADGSVVSIAELTVTPPTIDVRARN